MINVAGCAEQHPFQILFEYRAPISKFQATCHAPIASTPCTKTAKEVLGQTGVLQILYYTSCRSSPYLSLMMYLIFTWIFAPKASGWALLAATAASDWRERYFALASFVHWLLHWVSVYSCVFVVLHHSSSKLEVLQRHREQTGCGLLGLWTGGWRPAILCVWRRLWTGYEMLWVETSGTNIWGMNVHLLKFTYQLFFSPEYDGFDS